MTTESGSPAGARPRWLNPFVVAFLLGVIALTALPFLQQRFLKAPPPIAHLTDWTLFAVDDGRALSSMDLRGSVYLAFFAAGNCDGPCLERQRGFGRGIDHTDDLGSRVQLVTFARKSSREVLKGLAGGRWHIVSGEDEALSVVLDSFHQAWSVFAGTDAGTTFEERVALPACILVDQNGDVRGFWRDDVAGRGNAINAARLLAKYGPVPSP